MTGKHGAIVGYKSGGVVRVTLRRLVPEQARRAVWVGVMNVPAAADLYLRLDPTVRHRRVTRRTDLIMEGFPRSGNTYARAAFEHANGTSGWLSTHLHTPRSIEQGVRLGIPTIALVRAPQDVLGSLLQFNPRYHPGSVLKSYCAFYERVLPLSDAVVVADFSETIGDFGSVIERCNARFGTSFTPYTRTYESDRAVFRAIDEVAMRHHPHRFPHVVSRPVAARRGADEVAATLNDVDRLRLAEAHDVYTRLVRATTQRASP
jgi:hypothetical protein